MNILDSLDIDSLDEFPLTIIQIQSRQYKLSLYRKIIHIYHNILFTKIYIASLQ